MSWATGGSLEDEDSYGSSPPSYSKTGGGAKGRGGGGAKASARGKDVYDFDISNDDDDDDGFPMKPSSSSGVRGSFGDRARGTSSMVGSSRENPTRRISLEERTKEIQRSIGGSRPTPLETESPLPSPKGAGGKKTAGGKAVGGGDADWQRSYEDLMKGLAESPDAPDAGRGREAPLSPLSPSGGLESPKSGFRSESAGDSSCKLPLHTPSLCLLLAISFATVFTCSFVLLLFCYFALLLTLLFPSLINVDVSLRRRLAGNLRSRPRGWRLCKASRR